jgi:predicted RNA-binding protein with PUA-like domain
MKSEPDVFGIDDLAVRPGRREPWDGVRNYQARNMLRDEMQVGDRAFFYHSSCKVPGIVGTMEIVRAGYPDASAMNPQSPYYDPGHTDTKPRWYRVDVQFERKFDQPVTLETLRASPELADLPLLRRGNRLSIMPVTPEQWVLIVRLAEPPSR